MTAQLTLTEVKKQIKQLDSQSNRAKTQAGEKLKGFKVYPNLVDSPEAFLHDIVMPIILHFSSPMERVRFLCVEIIRAYVKQLGNKNLIDTLTYVLQPIYSRLKKDVEPSEGIQLELMTLLRDLLDLVSPDSYPSTWDNFAPPMEEIFKYTLSSNDPDMKKMTYEVLDAVVCKSSFPALQAMGLPLMKAIIPNLQHRHNEIRKLSLLTLSHLLVKSQAYDEMDKLNEVLEKLAHDKNKSVRKALIEFCRTMLVEHPMRHVMYHPMMLILFFYLAPLIPVRPIYPEIPPKQDEITEEALLSWEAIVEIGKQHEEDKFNDLMEELQYFDGEDFDSERQMPRGLTHIVQDLFPKMMDRLIPRLSDWKEDIRHFGYGAMRSVLHCARNYATRYVPQITHSLSISLRDHKEETETIREIAAVLADHVSASDIINVMVTKLTPDGPKEILMLFATTTVNDKPNDGELGLILESLLENHSYEALEAVDDLARLVVAMIQASQEFVDVNIVNLLSMILRICEHTDAMKYFQNVFGKPIENMFEDHIQQILQNIQPSPKILEKLLLMTPAKSIEMQQKLVCQILEKGYMIDPIAIQVLTTELAKKKVFHSAPPGFVTTLLEHHGINSALLLTELIKQESIDDTMVDSDIDILIVFITRYLDDSNDEVRQAGILTLLEFVKRSHTCTERFDTLYPLISERMKDHDMSIKINSVKVLSTYLPKCQENKQVPEKFPDILITMDDDVEEIRNAVADLFRTLVKIGEWKEPLIAALKSAQNYHHEAIRLTQQLISEFE